jgi:AcrR family transcriptional regulator
MGDSPSESGAPKRAGRTDLVVRGGTQLRRRPSVRRQERYDEEVRTLIAAAQSVMVRLGAAEAPRVADILAEAGMTNQAFYRHFRSRDDLIIAIYEHRLQQLSVDVAGRLSRARSPAGKVRAWITGVLAQVHDPELAQIWRAIVWNASQIPTGVSDVEQSGSRRLRDLLASTLEQGTSADREWDATAISTLVIALSTRSVADGYALRHADVDRTVRFCLRAVDLAPKRPPRRSAGRE